MLSKKTDNRGFSLIELLVVIAIVVVLIAGSAIGLSFLTGAQAKQAAKKFDAELNDVKTGNLAKAGEVLELTYFGDSDVDEEKGIDRPGYYTIKDSYTIMNTSAGSDIKVSLAGTDGFGNFLDREYSYLGNGNVEIAAVYSDGSAKNPKTDAVDIEFSRKDGSLQGDSEELSYITFKSGSMTYAITFEKVTGTHKMVDEDPGAATP